MAVHVLGAFGPFAHHPIPPFQALHLLSETPTCLDTVRTLDTLWLEQVPNAAVP